MRIAVISDIHANLIALKEVLKDIQIEGCNKIYCLGDLMLAGPQPKETMQYIMSQDWDIVQGNTDELIVEYGPDVIEMMKENFPVMGVALNDDMNFVTPDVHNFLGSLPTEIEEEIDGVKILMVHGSPRKNNENIFPEMPINEVEEIIAGTDANLILCGHTHKPCGYQTSTGQTVVNVGSVGRPMTPTPYACYAVIDIDKGTFSIKHKFVDYNREKAMELIRNRGFEGAEIIANLLVNTQESHV